MTLRLATRGSALALAQSRQVADALCAARPGLQVEIVTVTTTGDRVQDRPLHDIGGKGLFTKEVELALLAGEADFAVHSFKDVPVTMPLVARAEEELVIASVPRREDARDALVTQGGGGVDDLPIRATVGTTSLRRRALLLNARPDLDVVTLRGNVDTRLARLAGGDFDAILLAVAGLKRMGRWDPAMMRPLDEAAFTPAAGQGALALQCRRDDVGTRSALAALDHPPTRRCVQAERALVQALGGDCTSPIGAHATGGAVWFRLRACFEINGRLHRAEHEGDRAESVADVVASQFRSWP